MYNAKSIAYAVLSYCEEHNYMMSNLKLQKVLYFIQAQFLVSEDVPCFEDDIEAWDFGPVVQSVYYQYRMFGGAGIILNKDDPLIPYYQYINYRDMETIGSMIDELSKYSSSKLVEITHNQTPWKKNFVPYAQRKIPLKDIENFFK